MTRMSVIGLLSTLACASTSSTSSPTGSSAAQRADSRSCSSPLVAAVVDRDTDVFASPDSTSLVIASLPNSAKVCADPSVTGFGFRRVKLANGRDGFVDDANVSTM